ncbi:MAG: PepSY-associated TM helix domain-containing protein, partial [Akkermansiaceae bacterium]|nr:PepSY-associated TM helix domain-containing protein [Armatimonadota bacterium]
LVSFKAPGYAADGYIDRRTGTYRLTTTEEGAVAAMNDLHKGRHSGAVWSKVVDISAIFLVIISLTGLGLVFFLKRLRVAALITVCGGIALTLLLIRFFVP